MAKDAAAKLRNLLEQVFADSVVSAQEHAAIAALRTNGSLSEAEIQEVFAAFTEAKWGEAMADGRLTPQEKALMLGILRELKLPEEKIPTQLRMALLGS
jgi:tellurite resistance protein